MDKTKIEKVVDDTTKKCENLFNNLSDGTKFISKGIIELSNGIKKIVVDNLDVFEKKDH